MTKITAPWTDTQVAELNQYQFSYHEVHQYTCGNGSHVLIATTGGWICSHYPECNYTQDWAMVGEIGGEDVLQTPDLR